MTDDSPGGSEWFRQVLAQYEAPLLRYVARLAGNAEVAHDVVQDAFLRLARQDHAQLDGHVAQWLYTVCRNRALDVRRKENRVQHLDEASAATCEVSNSRPEAPLIVAEETQRTLAVLVTLPEQQQEAIRLKFQEGLSYREIAAVLGLTVNHVGVLLHTALKTLRHKLSANDSEDADRESASANRVGQGTIANTRSPRGRG